MIHQLIEFSSYYVSIAGYGKWLTAILHKWIELVYLVNLHWRTLPMRYFHNIYRQTESRSSISDSCNKLKRSFTLELFHTYSLHNLANEFIPTYKTCRCTYLYRCIMQTSNFASILQIYFDIYILLILYKVLHKSQELVCHQ